MNIEEIIQNFSPEYIIELSTSSPPWWLIMMFILVSLFMFLGMREFFCWFWKLNSLTASLNQINSELKLLNSKLEKIPNSTESQNADVKTTSMQIKQDF